MEFAADFHIHSKFSRATAKNLDLEHLHVSAQFKGITVLGTGDFTHPAWFSEIEEKLEPANNGLFKLKPHLSKPLDMTVPPICRRTVYFMLVSEISNIYKKGGKTRKNHNLVFLPDLDTAEKFNTKLDRIGNIKSDGRPILGLDSRDLLEILLETAPEAYLVPAHIWTPWFSMLGSKSGFDSIEACFDDLTPHVFALETGLSSDPAMNRRVSWLDGQTLISNSDAHSPSKLGREANLFRMEPSFDDIRSALMTPGDRRFLGTIEFYPEEGKYHLDGHRKCRVRLEPKTTLAQACICPVCKKPITLGVLHRVEELADRPESEQPKKTRPFYRRIPLVEVLSEIFNVGPATKTVEKVYGSLIENLGPEFDILQNLPLDALEDTGIPMFHEAISRVRQNNVHVLPGYDGEFGTVSIFDAEEREKIQRQRVLFKTGNRPAKRVERKAGIKQKARVTPIKKKPARPAPRRPEKKRNRFEKTPAEPYLKGLNAEQKKIVYHGPEPLVVVAGPGTGKTHTLTCRIAHLIETHDVAPERILSITFTNKAAQEMKDRLRSLLKGNDRFPHVTTFHGFCWDAWCQQTTPAGRDQKRRIVDDRERKWILSESIKTVKKSGVRLQVKTEDVLRQIVSAKQGMFKPSQSKVKRQTDLKKDVFSEVYETYQNRLNVEGLCDFEDLIANMVTLLKTDPAVKRRLRQKYTHLFVDEFQDINAIQYELILTLAPRRKTHRHLCVIGDPDQSIYGFRGSDIRFFKQLIVDYPNLVLLYLTRNYRSTRTILDASHHVIKNHTRDALAAQVYSEKGGKNHIQTVRCHSGKAEAETVGKFIEAMIGGTGYFSVDSGRVMAHQTVAPRSFSDFAVLYRTADQGVRAAELIEGCGIPCQTVSKRRFYHDRRADELISILKLISGAGSFMDLEKTAGLISPETGKGVIERFKAWAWQNNQTLKGAMDRVKRMPIPEMSIGQQRKLTMLVRKIEEIERAATRMTVEEKLRSAMDRTRLSVVTRKRPENLGAINCCLDTSRDFGRDTGAFINAVALQTDTDTYDPRVEKVSLMTMHAAKGLEFPVVFIIGCENGFSPYQKPSGGTPDLEEERRLFYVAMTRAKEELYLMWAEKRKRFGKTLLREISPFVLEIEKTLLRESSPSRGKKPRRSHYRQLGLFQS